MVKSKNDKIYLLKLKLKYYEDKLTKEMIGYRGVIHESAVSEIKHSKVMVYRAMVEALRDELKKLESQ